MQYKIVTNKAKLREVCKSAETADQHISKVARALLDYMWARKTCAGLAANQLGFDIRVICVPVVHQLKVLINPEIVERSELEVAAVEGCESLPGVKVMVKRHWMVKVKDSSTREYVLAGLEARIVQHEIDHLDGILIIDKGG